ncbi:dicarboxylate/amino acid:cation symporter [Weeksellaceae bacterium TAE3-ERU29]|nr:dicarboxylate/amino acid:cation symporter [Weeksellaceae bacterium TAE3-ERU29]
MKKILSNLLVIIIIAIFLGILSGLYLPEWFNRIFTTFNNIFSEFLSFSIPLIIMGLIMPAIADLGKNAKKLLLVTISIAYASTFFSGFMTYFVSDSLFPKFINTSDYNSVAETSKELLPYFTISVPPPFDIMTALALAFTIGLGLSIKTESILFGAIKDFELIIIQLIKKAIIPLLPIYIFSIFVNMAFSGKVFSVLNVFIKIIAIIFIMHIALILIQYIIAGTIAKKNPIKALRNMLPAYFTALGTQSSAATIPITLQQVEKNGVSKDISRFTVPFCATIHLSGSTMKIVACTIALMLMQGIPYNFELFAGFILMLGIVMIAAPGVPGGAIMASVGLLESMMGFNNESIALMIALYIAMDSFGTACNVTGDGAISLIVDKIFSPKKC